MQCFKFHRADTGLFDQQQIDLVYHQENFLPFIRHVFAEDNIEDQIELKRTSFGLKSRLLLKESLVRQYTERKKEQAVMTNIDRLEKESSFTVTTGHQLSLFTGPLFFVIKIVQVIKQCESLKLRFPQYDFVPVYWMASEDHDFEEVKSTSIFNKTLSWDTAQSGAVGRFKPEGLSEIRKSIHDLFQRYPEAEIHDIIDCFEGSSYADAHANLVHALFGKYGLVIMDGDDPALKRSFVPFVKKELEEGFSFKAVSETSIELKKNGARLQVSPREINLFYLGDGIRSRIVMSGNHYTAEGLGDVTPKQLNELLESQPECFSPNVILRPLYQEVVLPNLLYVGGAGEISYWLQLKKVFDTCDIPFPLIQVRNSLIWIDHTTHEKLNKTGVLLESIFKTNDELKFNYIAENETEILNFEPLERAFSALNQELDDLVTKVDQNLLRFKEAELTKLRNQIEQIKAKLIKASKGKHDEAMQNIDQIKSKLFPANNLQERVVSFFSFCPEGNVTERLELLFRTIDPEEKDLLIIREF